MRSERQKAEGKSKEEGCDEEMLKCYESSIADCLDLPKLVTK